jgi:hypothetical protein
LSEIGNAENVDALCLLVEVKKIVFETITRSLRT